MKSILKIFFIILRIFKLLGRSSRKYYHVDNQMSIFRGTLKEFSNPRHPLYNLGHETIMPDWVRDPYSRYFCGESGFQWTFPCDPSDLLDFLKRIGKDGAENILALSARLEGNKDLRKREVIVDSTFQEKNITYPTDIKLYRKFVEKCNKINGKTSDNAIVGRGYKGKKMNGSTQIIFPGSPIGKSDCRMERDYLKGTVGDEINAILAAIALNFRRILRITEQDIILTFLCWQILPEYKLNPVPI